jgi:hypothetical protein
LTPWTSIAVTINAHGNGGPRQQAEASMSVSTAIEDVEQRFALPITAVLTPGPEHMHVMTRLLEGAGCASCGTSYRERGTAYSQDADFAHFPEMRWVNPLAR